MVSSGDYKLGTQFLPSEPAKVKDGDLSKQVISDMFQHMGSLGFLKGIYRGVSIGFL